MAPKFLSNFGSRRSGDEAATRGPSAAFSIFNMVLHLVAVVFSIIVLGLVADLISDLHSISCSSTPTLDYNIAVAVIALFLLVVVCVGGFLFRKHTWFLFVQLAIDFVLFVFWLAAAATSPVSCNSLCNACSFIQSGFVYLDSAFCYCESLDLDPFDRRDMSPAPGTAGLFNKRARVVHTSHSSNSGGSSGSIIAARKAFDALQVVLFAGCLILTVITFLASRKDHNGEHHRSGNLATSGADMPMPAVPNDTKETSAPNTAPTQPSYPTQEVPSQYQQPTGPGPNALHTDGIHEKAISPNPDHDNAGGHNLTHDAPSELASPTEGPINQGSDPAAVPQRKAVA